MKKVLALVLTLALLLPAAGLAQETVNVLNWYDYIDESVFQLFEEETGIHVNPMYCTTNEEMLVTIEANPGTIDVCFPSFSCIFCSVRLIIWRGWIKRLRCSISILL